MEIGNMEIGNRTCNELGNMETEIIKQDLSVKREGRIKGKVLEYQERNNMPVLTFPLLSECDIVDHLFTTRLGGVSKGVCSSMNLGFHRGDEKEAVEENYRRLAAAMHLKDEDLVCTVQTHTTNIRIVTEADKGKGVVLPTDYRDVDGMITKEKGIGLVALFADCVPLYFVDPVKKAIGLAHSGWRGTVNRMGEHMVKAMEKEFGSDPKDILTAIGPSICVDCYEVDEVVASRFREEFKADHQWIERIREENLYFPHNKKWEILNPGKEEGKYQLDLWLTNLIILLKAGIEPEHVAVTDICTCHNSEFLFSHRASAGKRGNLAACLMLR